MNFYQETTVWEGHVPNHIYLLDNSKQFAHGFVSALDGVLKMFSRPIRFDTRRRSFVKVDNQWGVDLTERKDNVVARVSGSKGNEYVITRGSSGLSCSCSGFKFRGTCKHIKAYQ